jgi:phosphocarrier protein HPr
LTLAMTECEVTIRNRLGLHARAAAKFVHLASRFRAQVRVSREGRVVDGKSIMGILLLAAAHGTTIMISADGADAGDALTALCELVESGFGEDTWNA